MAALQCIQLTVLRQTCRADMTKICWLREQLFESYLHKLTKSTLKITTAIISAKALVKSARTEGDEAFLFACINRKQLK